MAAGALYGPWLGGWLPVAGSFAGAMAAFGLARRFGHERLGKAAHPLAEWITRPRSQSGLMAIVLVSRLVPPISFDAVSYAAGLTAIETRRFAVATLIGVVPVSFGFAAMGAGLSAGVTPTLAALAVSVTLALPAAAAVLARARSLHQRRQAGFSPRQQSFHSG
jgi:uncharacterized membrane protein YdjX (TVP38/TMEM64 family)